MREQPYEVNVEIIGQGKKRCSEVCSDWLTFGARWGSGWRGRTSARDSEREDRRLGESSRSPNGSVARQNSKRPFDNFVIFFPIAPVDFQSIRRGEGSELFFGTFFFFCDFWGRGGGRGGGGPRNPRHKLRDS